MICHSLNAWQLSSVYKLLQKPLKTLLSATLDLEILSATYVECILKQTNFFNQNTAFFIEGHATNIVRCRNTSFFTMKIAKQRKCAVWCEIINVFKKLQARIITIYCTQNLRILLQVSSRLSIGHFFWNGVVCSTVSNTEKKKCNNFHSAILTTLFFSCHFNRKLDIFYKSLESVALPSCFLISSYLLASNIFINGNENYWFQLTVKLF